MIKCLFDPKLLNGNEIEMINELNSDNNDNNTNEMKNENDKDNSTNKVNKNYKVNENGLSNGNSLVINSSVTSVTSVTSGKNDKNMMNMAMKMMDNYWKPLSLPALMLALSVGYSLKTPKNVSNNVSKAKHYSYLN